MSTAPAPDTDEEIVKVRGTVKECEDLLLLVQSNQNHAWVRRCDCRRIVRRIGDSIVIEMLARVAIERGLNFER